jgi:hypothetical protein
MTEEERNELIKQLGTQLNQIQKDFHKLVHGGKISKPSYKERVARHRKTN